MGLSFNREPRLPFAFKTCEVVLLLMAGYALKGSRHTLVLRVCVCGGGVALNGACTVSPGCTKEFFNESWAYVVYILCEGIVSPSYVQINKRPIQSD